MKTMEEIENEFDKNFQKDLEKEFQMNEWFEADWNRRRREANNQRILEKYGKEAQGE